MNGYEVLRDWRHYWTIPQIEGYAQFHHRHLLEYAKQSIGRGNSARNQPVPMVAIV